MVRWPASCDGGGALADGPASLRVNAPLPATPSTLMAIEAPRAYADPGVVPRWRHLPSAQGWLLASLAGSARARDESCQPVEELRIGLNRWASGRLARGLRRPSPVPIFPPGGLRCVNAAPSAALTISPAERVMCGKPQRTGVSNGKIGN